MIASRAALQRAYDLECASARWRDPVRRAALIDNVRKCAEAMRPARRAMPKEEHDRLSEA